MTVGVVAEIERVTKMPHRLIVLGWAETDELWCDLAHRLATEVPAAHLVRNDRQGRPDIQPSQRNKVLDVARGFGDEPFALVHNDVMPGAGWLDRLLEDLKWAENRWGIGSSVISPRYIPFHRADTISKWPDPVLFKTAEEMEACCTEQLGLEFNRDAGHVVCPAWLPPTDDGHQLMMFVARPSFFDGVGECDECFAGFNYDDCEWGMRALMAGKKNLISQSAFMGHVATMSFGLAGALAPTDNEKVFVAKWGRALFDELITGKLWLRLHAEQEKMAACAMNQ